MEFITLDKKRPINFDLLEVSVWGKDVGISLAGIAVWLTDPCLDGTLKLLYHGLRGGARKEGTVYELSYEKTVELVQDMDKLKDIFDIFLVQYSDGSKAKEGKPKGSS